MESDLRNLAEVTATRLSKHVVIPLWDLDKVQIDEMLRSEMLEKRLAAVIIRDSNGKAVFAGKERGANWQVVDVPAKGVTEHAEFIPHSKHITKGTEKIGDVEVYLTPKFLQDELEHSTMQVVTSVLVLDVVIFIAVLLALRRLVIRPIGKLAEAAEGMSMGNLDVAIGVNSKDEIGHVADAMDRMKISLQMAMQRLQQR
jgi:nitrate/nitrite-specific signal transduction histidine kinase